jgi:hypothetical protein
VIGRTPRATLSETSHDSRSKQPDRFILRDCSMVINSEQTPFRPARLNAASAMTPAVRLRIYRFASACRKSRTLWRKWETRTWPWLTNPFAWTLVALIVSSIGLYWDLH